MDRRIARCRGADPAKHIVDASLPFGAKANDMVRVIKIRVSRAAVVAADSRSLAVLLNQAVQESESDSALGIDRVSAALDLSLAD